MDNEETQPAPAPVAAPPTGPSGSESAAILLMMLGDNEAAEILSHLEPHEVQHLGSAMFNVADVSETQVATVFVPHRNVGVWVGAYVLVPGTRHEYGVENGDETDFVHQTAPVAGGALVGIEARFP